MVISAVGVIQPVHRMIRLFQRPETDPFILSAGLNQRVPFGLISGIEMLSGIGVIHPEHIHRSDRIRFLCISVCIYLIFCNCGLRIRNLIPAACLIAFYRPLADRWDIACLQLQHLPFSSGQGHILFGRCSVIPQSVDDLEGDGI